MSMGFNVGGKGMVRAGRILGGVGAVCGTKKPAMEGVIPAFGARLCFLLPVMIGVLAADATILPRALGLPMLNGANLVGDPGCWESGVPIVELSPWVAPN